MHIEVLTRCPECGCDIYKAYEEQEKAKLQAWIRESLTETIRKYEPELRDAFARTLKPKEEE